jgi:hypothetical protein
MKIGLSNGVGAAISESARSSTLRNAGGTPTLPGKFPAFLPYSFAAVFGSGPGAHFALMSLKVR